jgi:uncharacterized repeat protein (TIGR01451 family)
MRAAVLFACVWPCVVAAPLAAQTQIVAFQPPQPPFGGLSSGVLRGPISHAIGEIGANQVGVDQDGDTVPDVIYDLPPAIRRDTQSPARWAFEDRLSPTQGVLYTRRFRNTAGSPNPPPVCDNDPASHEVFFHSLGPPPAMTLLGSACVRGPLSRGPVFHDPGPNARLRTGMVVAAPNPPNQEVAWFDLVSGGAGEDGATYQANVSVTAEGVLVSPFGNAFYLRHRTGGAPGPPARYSIVDLCADRTGGAVTTRDEPAQASGIRVEHRQDAGGLSAVVTFTLAGGGELAESFTLANCFGGNPPPLRRLTVTVIGSGGVVSNPPGIACGAACAADFPEGTTVRLQAFPTAAGAVFTGWTGDCSGAQLSVPVLLDADRACTATFGNVQIAVAKSADAATASPGQTLTYTLTASNQGSAPATNVTLSDTLPVGVDFVAAPGGTFSGAVANWSLGTVAPGASAQARFQVRPRCQVASVVNQSYAADADAVPPTAGTPVTTPVSSPPTSPVTVSVVSVPDRVPLRGGDRLIHTVTLTNNGPADHPHLRLVTHLGDAASLDALVDAGTGSFSFVPPTTLTWTGPLAAGATTSLVVRVRIDDCFSGDRTWLNSGSPLDVFNFCSQRVGSGQPAGPFALQKPIEAALTAVDPQRTTQGTLPAIRYVAGRPGEPFDLQLTLTNHFATDAPGITVNAALPPGLSPVGDPPFVPPTDPGAAWDATSRTVSWSGTVPGSGTVTLTFRVAVDVGARCWTNVAVQGGRAGCSDIRDGTVVLAAPLPPATPHVIAVDVLEGLYLWEPGVDRNFRELLCVHAGEFHAGLGRTADGDLWMAGLPTFRANLSPLELQAFPPGAFDTPARSFEEENDVAGDATDGTVVVLGGRGGAGGLARYDPATGQTTDIGALPSRAGRVLVEPDRTIAALAGDRIHRLDPADPTNPRAITFPGYAGLGSFDREADGDYVVLAARPAGGGFAEDLLEVDPATGAITPILADLDAATGNATVPHGPLAVAPDGTVFLTRADGRELYRVDRATAPPTVTALSTAGTVTNPRTPGVFLTSVRDMVFVGGAPTPAAADVALAKAASPDPVPAGGPLAFVLTATNLGPDAAAQVVVSDPLPAGVAFDRAASDLRCDESNGTVACDLGDLSAGQAESVTVVVSVDRTASGVLSNTATVASATTDPVGGNNSATAAVSVTPAPPPRADLDLTKTAAPQPLIVGQDVTYTLTVGNAGPEAATGVRVTDGLPSTLAFVPGGPGAACMATGATVTCDLGAVAAGATARATFVARPLLLADLGVTRLDVAPAGPAIAGDSVVYTVDVTNHGPGDARGVRLTTLTTGFDPSGSPLAPLDVTIGSAQASRGACSALGTNGRPPLACALGNLLPGERARVTIVATPNAATTTVGQPSGALVNAARVSSDGVSLPDLDPDTANDDRSVATVVLPAGAPDLAITRAEAQPARPLVLGGDLIYDLEVTNHGSGSAADVRLFTLASGFGPDGLPDGPPLDVTVLSLASSQGTCTPPAGGTGPLECALGGLGPGGRAQVTVVVRPNSATVFPGQPPSPLVNRSRVTTAGALAGTPDDPHAANDVAAVSSVVLPAAGVADLAVTAFEVAPTTPLVRGGELSYVLQVTNFGPQPALDVVVYTMATAFTNDGRPTGPPPRAQLVSILPSQGACAGSGNGPVECLLGTLVPGASAQVDLVVSPEAATVAVGAPGDPLVNAASVTTEAALSGNDLDPHRANNTASVASTVLERLPDSIGNAAVVASGLADPDPADNASSVSTPLAAPPPPAELRADLAVVLAGPAEAMLGIDTPYTLTVANAGPDAAAGAGVFVGLSPGLALVASTSTFGACTGGRAVSCSLGELPAGGTASLTLVVRPRAIGVQTLTAEVAAFGTVDPAPADNEASLAVVVRGPPGEPDGENIDPAGTGEQFAYAENAGWINLEPLGDGGPGVQVGDAGLSGWMWGENVGWCSLSCRGTGSCGAVDFGVTQDGRGRLAGFAWCENAGWISFSCANTASCSATPYGVFVDPGSGLVSGEAWGENVGWIAFGGSGSVPYRVVTSWRGAP